MKNRINRQTSIEDLIKGVSKPEWTLRSYFNDRIEELSLTFTASADLLNIQTRTLKGILDGTQKSVDITNIVKLAEFLRLENQVVFDLYLESLNNNFEIESSLEPEKIKFLKENFDLAALKKAGFLSNINNYVELEGKITSFLGLNSILEYQPPKQKAAFSEGKIKPKNQLTRDFWVSTANELFKEISNPYEFDRDKLIEYFPDIRRYCTSVNLGLFNVIRDLYRLGVTVAYLPSFSSLHLRGATISINRKPCIVLTDYRGFYSTFWFALIHELFHVIFDWDEIKTNRYHISDPNSEQLTVAEREVEADNFARTYLFSDEKLAFIKPRIKDETYVNGFAEANHVHPSFIYTFYAFDPKTKDRQAWPIAQKNNPDIKPIINLLDNDWKNPKSLKEYVKPLKKKLYN